MAEPTGGAPLFSAVASSARQLFYLLRTISFASRVQVRITAEGIRFSASETGVLDSFIFLSTPLFQSYRLNSPSDTTDPITFSLPLSPLLSTLQILSSASSTQPEPGSYNNDAYSSAFAAHRLSRHSAFSASVLGTQGQCRIVYRSLGGKLELSVPETGGVRTGCSLVTYLSHEEESGFVNGERTENGEGIPFDRSELRLKVILPSSVLADAVVEVNSLGGMDIFVIEGSATAPYLVLRGEGGAGGECRVEFGNDVSGTSGLRSKLLETFLCQGTVRERYGFGTVKKALPAMRAGTKVSMRIDGRGVLSLQFLVEVGEEDSEGGRKKDEAFVDFRIVPLFERDEGDGESGEDDEDEDW